MRQVLGLSALFGVLCPALQPEVYPVPEAGEQVSPCACLCLSQMLFANLCRSRSSFVRGVKLSSALQSLSPLVGVVLEPVPSSVMALLCSLAMLIVQLPGSANKSRPGIDMV